VKDVTDILTSHVQAKGEDLALCLPGKGLHVQAICCGLKDIRESLRYVKCCLDEFENMEKWKLEQVTVAREVTTAAMFLDGILDACVISELPETTVPRTNMSFYSTSFQDTELKRLQQDIRLLESNGDNAAQTRIKIGLKAVVNFWKHYMPYQHFPTKFTKGREHPIMDFMVEGKQCSNEEKDFDEDQKNYMRFFSGPIVHDLLIPAFDLACQIADRLIVLKSVDKKYRVPQIGK